jgi:hypothetical protein
MILLGITGVIILATLVAGNYLDLIKMRQGQEQKTEDSI